MTSCRRNNIAVSLRIAVVVSTIVACLLIFGTLWIGKNVKSDTEQAVHTVSLFYLDELTTRREQVIASTIQAYINNLDVAIGLIGKEDLVSLDRLQAYQLRSNRSRVRKNRDFRQFHRGIFA